MPRGIKKSAASEAQAEDGEKYGIEDYMLPKATVARLAKTVLPANTHVQKDAMTALSKSATVFINYLTSTANEITVQSGRKTVSPADVFQAVEILDLAFMLPRLTAEVEQFADGSVKKVRRAGDDAAKKVKVGNGKAVRTQDDDETEVEDDEDDEEVEEELEEEELEGDVRNDETEVEIEGHDTVLTKDVDALESADSDSD